MPSGRKRGMEQDLENGGRTQGNPAGLQLCSPVSDYVNCSSGVLLPMRLVWVRVKKEKTI